MCCGTVQHNSPSTDSHRIVFMIVILFTVKFQFMLVSIKTGPPTVLVFFNLVTVFSKRETCSV